MATVLNKTIIANASSAVDTYVTTATALYQELNTLITTLTTSNFQGDAADGFKEFFNNKATPILVDSLTAPNTSLTAGLKQCSITSAQVFWIRLMYSWEREIELLEMQVQQNLLQKFDEILQEEQ